MNCFNTHGIVITMEIYSNKILSQFRIQNNLTLLVELLFVATESIRDRDLEVKRELNNLNKF